MAQTVHVRHRIAASCTNLLKNIKGGYFGRERFLLMYFIYHFLPWFGYDYPKLIEWKFILKDLPQESRSRILDIGCTSSLFIYELAHRGEAFGIDSRPYFERLPSSIQFSKSDISQLPFNDNYFDYMTLISVIEHVGLGSYGDMRYRDGDLKAMKELKRVLKSNGRLFLTTLIANEFIITPDQNERIYDEKHFDALIADFVPIKESYYIFRKRWIPVEREVAFQEPPCRFALVCLQLRKR